MFPSIYGKTKKNDPLQDDIRTAIRNATGPRAKLFIPEVVGTLGRRWWEWDSSMINGLVMLIMVINGWLMDD